MESLWTPLFSIMVFTLVFGMIGGLVSSKTKAIISAVIVGCMIYLIGYLTGIIPTNSPQDTGLTTMMSNFGIALMVTNLGTMINLKDLVKEWKTVVIAIIGLVGLAVVSFTIGSWIFGREYALSAASPISGGVIATILTTTAATEAGRPEIAAFATLICSLQLFAGLPIASKCLKIEANKMVNNKYGIEIDKHKENKEKKEWNLKIIPDWPKWCESTEIVIFKLSFVAVIASFISNLTILEESTQPILNSTILCLILGVIFTEIGFLDRNALQKANAYGLLLLGLIALLPGNFSSISFSSLLDMIIPIIGILIIGAAGISIFAIITGKILNYSVPMSVAIGVTALIGYPCTQIVTDEVVDALETNDEQKAAIKEYILPKMLVGGFTTVTIASVVFAGIIVPMIF